MALQKTKHKIKPLIRSANFAPETANEEERTVEVVFATETPVRMNTWDGPIMEILSFGTGHVRFDRLNSGAPVLDNHDRYSGVRGQLGTVVKAWSDGAEGRAIIRFSKREDVTPIWNDIKDGIVRGISVGYRVFAYEKKEVEGSLPEYRAVDWEPFEISLAPVQADHNSQIRSEGVAEHEVEITQERKEQIQTNNQIQNIMKREQIIALLAKRGITVTDSNTDAELQAMLERELEKEPNNDGIKNAVDAERKRTAEINAAVRKANLPVEFAERLITEGKSVDEARALVIEEFAKQDPNKGSRSAVVVGKDEKEKKREAISDAIASRAMPSQFEATDKAREYRGMTLFDIAKDIVEENGTSTRGMSREEIAKEALGIRSGAHSTSDFPIILGNTVNRTLRKAYELQNRTFLPFVGRANAADFKQMTRAQIGEGSNFEEVAEGGEYTFATMGEGKEVYAVKKYGKIYAITWESIINDDLGAFNRIPRNIAFKAASKQSDLVYAILTGNPTMGDGNALFHSTHGNLTGTGTAISVDSLTKMRELMRKQKGVDAKDFLNIAPKFLIVAPEKEGLAYQYTSANYVPATPGTVNPDFNKSLQTIVEPRLSSLNSGLSWFGAADPNMIDTIEIAFLEGEGELFTEQRVGFDVDGLQIKARMVFGAKAIDWRGLYKNVGA